MAALVGRIVVIKDLGVCTVVKHNKTTVFPPAFFLPWPSRVARRPSPRRAPQAFTPKLPSTSLAGVLFSWRRPRTRRARRPTEILSPAAYKPSAVYPPSTHTVRTRDGEYHDIVLQRIKFGQLIGCPYRILEDPPEPPADSLSRPSIQRTLSRTQAVPDR